jgi:hypothetical protein
MCLDPAADAFGVGRRRSVLRPLRIPDYRTPAGQKGPARLLFRLHFAARFFAFSRSITGSPVPRPLYGSASIGGTCRKPCKISPPISPFFGHSGHSRSKSNITYCIPCWWGPLRYTGRIAYGLYLLQSLAERIVQALPRGRVGAAAGFVLTIGISYALASLLVFVRAAHSSPTRLVHHVIQKEPGGSHFRNSWGKA